MNQKLRLLSSLLPCRPDRLPKHWESRSGSCGAKHRTARYRIEGLADVFSIRLERWRSGLNRQEVDVLTTLDLESPTYVKVSFLYRPDPPSRTR